MRTRSSAKGRNPRPADKTRGKWMIPLRFPAGLPGP